MNIMLATSVVDPLLTSPQRARHHDDNMAALQKTSFQNIPPLELPPSSHAAAEEDEEDAETPLDQLLNRGNYLRQLRLLALADEQERQAQEYAECISITNNAHNDNIDAGTFCEEKKEDFDDAVTSNSCCASDVQELQDKVTILPTKEKVLDYNSYLAHQRYYDDLKHVDIKYMDFGNIINNALNGEEDGGRLVVEQRKRLGKGGICWDAGFILGEHVIAHEHEWNTTNNDGAVAPRIVELGAGTGLTGLMIAKATRSYVTITDLPELTSLMIDNIERNFGSVAEGDSGDESINKLITTCNDDHKAKGTISSRVLRWGTPEDYSETPYDVIIGADIVTSLYDPVALAQTFHALAGPSTSIYISGKARLDKPHEEFDVEMHRLFERVQRIRRPSSRLRSPDVFIIVAEGKRSVS